jgi:hypothetical protein
MPLILCRANGLTYPQFKCDWCAKLIKNITTGAMVVWNDTCESDEAEITPVIVCECEKHVDYSKLPFSMELDASFICLQGRSFPNHKAYKEAVKKTNLLASLNP